MDFSQSSKPLMPGVMFPRIALTEMELSCSAWWNKRRLFYSYSLLVIGAISFILYAITFWSLQSRFHPEAAITLFTIVVQGIGYVIMVAIANIFYTIGPLLEKSFFSNNPINYRKFSFLAGYYFSCALPVSIPLYTLIVAVYFPYKQ